jgi:dTDP-4-dehydrorhamnose reductase
VVRELLYPWHPWFGLQVAIHEAVEKADGVVFRCTMSGSGADRWLEVPAWMFERAACPEQIRLVTEPVVKITALSALADLLRQVLKDQRASSNAPLSGASKFSHDQNRREGP